MAGIRRVPVDFNFNGQVDVKPVELHLLLVPMFPSHVKPDQDIMTCSSIGPLTDVPGTLKWSQQICTWKWMVGIRGRFLLGWPIFRCELLVSWSVLFLGWLRLSIFVWFGCRCAQFCSLQTRRSLRLDVYVWLLVVTGISMKIFGTFVVPFIWCLVKIIFANQKKSCGWSPLSDGKWWEQRTTCIITKLNRCRICARTVTVWLIVLKCSKACYGFFRSRVQMLV